MLRFALLLAFSSYPSAFCLRVFPDVLDVDALCKKLDESSGDHSGHRGKGKHGRAIKRNKKNGDHSGTSDMVLVTVAHDLPETFMKLLLADRKRLAKHNNNAELCFVDHHVSDRPGGWDKVVAIRSLLEAGKKTVVWIDADALAVHPKAFAEIESKFMPENKSIMVTNDVLEPYWMPVTEQSLPNTGVIVARQNSWSKKFFETLWKDFPPAMPDENSHWDQAAFRGFKHFHPEEWKANVEMIPHAIMNAHHALDYSHEERLMGGHAHGPIKDVVAAQRGMGGQTNNAPIQDFILHFAGNVDRVTKYDWPLLLYCTWNPVDECKDEDIQEVVQRQHLQ